MFHFSTSSYDWPRGATLRLIELYEEHPCLYLPALAEYHNRGTRIKALEEITKNFNKLHLTNLKVEDIKKKIHGLRTQFLAELQKIRKSEVSGTSADDIYVPKWWCFENLRFLQQGTKICAKGQSSLWEGLDHNYSQTQENASEIQESSVSSLYISNFNFEFGKLIK